MIREEMLKKLDGLIQSQYTTPAEWTAFRTELEAEHCGNCDYWTMTIRVSSKPINPGVCKGWLAGMFSISAEPDNEDVFKTYEDFYCSCFKTRQEAP